MNGLARWLTGYLVNSAWQIPVLAVCTAGLVKAMARGGARLHYRVWVGCLVLALVLPAVPPVGFGLGAGSGGRVGLVRMEMVGGMVVRRVSAGERVAAYAQEALQLVEESRAAEWLLGLYGFSIVAGSVRLGRRLWVTRAVVREARRMRLPPELSSSLLRSAEALGVGEVEVWSSAGLRCPATVNWPRAMLLVPEDFGAVEETDAAAAIGHELAHVRRRDFEVNLVLEAVSVMAFYHPALHWTARRVAESREEVCDEMAAEATLGRTAYAKSLLSLAESAAMPVAAASFLLGALEGNTLERRIMKLIDGRLPLSRRYRVISVVGCWVVLAVVSVGVVALSVRPSTAHAAGPEMKAEPMADVVAPPPPPVEMRNDAPRDPTQMQYLMPGVVERIGGDVSAPLLIHTVYPEFSEEARAAKFMGVVMVGLIVDEEGRPEDVHVVRGVGMGLDQRAVEAVSQYRFKPAMKNGEPVMVQLNVEVNFQIF